jgi:hypothetical protein
MTGPEWRIFLGSQIYCSLPRFPMKKLDLQAKRRPNTVQALPMFFRNLGGRICVLLERQAFFF